ncbi:Glyoxylase, beta-lactamase superfamily II [Paucidesulfovibrio gracilis DSM 16080]|uniref:Glyoxylase, beta-lactamase superfamily II n=1 Tax=Paucidesulfovibrio gracilis DSM 16080 TaxID=1121449 RepID=A0A1T4WJN5_9BACT|nr:MBL fold metallo-hydrolase [Paucidesulfovibrio gracilis]SKA76841.1 Glyoxylase, beta-lactamase superfamily II [Paucidesulfovibrio gracilis DSM 16080]
MYFKQISVPGLGCLSYVVGCPGAKAMAVVDPKRDIQDYLDISREEGMRITHIIDTHVHADHVSGAHELRAVTGAKIMMYETSPVDFPFHGIKEGERLDIGNARLEFMHTPGHTPDALSVLVTDRSRSEEPWMLLTGDVLFVGDIGRPDLAGADVIDEQVRNLYNTLYVKFAQLPDHLEVFPAHGMGSLCGKGMSSKLNSTLGFERRHNPMLQYPSFEAFHNVMTGDFPTRPKSFGHIISTNRDGAPLLECCPLEKAMTPEQFETYMAEGYLVIDTRDTAAFGGFHIPGSLNIGFEKQLANWVGMVVPPDADLLLVVEDRKRYDDMVTELHRIGYDRIFGYLAGGINAWMLSGRDLERLNQVSAGELAAMLDDQTATILDVRTPSELSGGGIPGAQSVPLTHVLDNGLDMSRDRDIVVYCGSGYRSNIAASSLKKQGFEKVRSLAGGIIAWTQGNHPLV